MPPEPGCGGRNHRKRGPDSVHTDPNPCQADVVTLAVPPTGVQAAAPKTSGQTVDPELRQFWEQLPLSQRCSIMKVGRKELFQRIRETYCSRCFGAFQLQYDELRK